MNKKGISMVALVITIIVLIILTGAVVMTGLNAPNNASTAVVNYNKTVVQDAVTIYVMNEIAKSALNESGATYTTVRAILSNLVATSFTDANATTPQAIKADMADELGLSGFDVTKYKVDGNGIVSQ